MAWITITITTQLQGNYHSIKYLVVGGSEERTFLRGIKFVSKLSYISSFVEGPGEVQIRIFKGIQINP